MHEPDNEQKDNKTKFNDPQTQQPTNKNKHQQRNKCKGITSKRIKRANREQPGLNRWPLDLQSNALPLSYAPPCNWVVILSKPCHAKRLPPCFHLSTPWPLRDNATIYRISIRSLLLLSRKHLERRLTVYAQSDWLDWTTRSKIRARPIWDLNQSLALRLRARKNRQSETYSNSERYLQRIEGDSIRPIRLAWLNKKEQNTSAPDMGLESMRLKLKGKCSTDWANRFHYSCI